MMVDTQLYKLSPFGVALQQASWRQRHVAPDHNSSDVVEGHQAYG